eukprot:CAMPEP_0115747520 /NCGR_PEP_ID=MMETSP0272-20121206/93200_1 /TAXON_ID=71861 /ORGANISM="Scrippsiella trochoidea, Strain CCMP3099" /LENGTH=73 /DNA_ID=CAMNT_0003192505 /DNA_START=1 /DNA_END=219 /DNA_ORIENTATION=+
MNPAHRGHVQLLHQAKARLEQAGYMVLAAFLSPTHDGYVQPKARRLGAVGLSGALRAELATRTIEPHDDLVEV